MLTVEIFATVIFVLLLLMRPVLSFRFNGFRHLTQEIKLSGSLVDMISYETHWLEQKLDNFDDNENRTWKMRYFERLDLWRPNGPIYMFLGGESESSPNFLKSGLAKELASETSGALYVTEHRYYGKSLPLNVCTRNVSYFKYLSAKQALADNAHLIRTIKSNPIFRKSKVVTIGGSYPGNLAAWMRLLYPELVDAAISSSAPVLAKKDFYEYLEKVSEDYDKYGTEGCWKAINDRFKWYDALFKTKEGIEKLKEAENICPENNMKTRGNRVKFFQHKITNFQEIAQYSNTYQIKRHCLNFNTIKEAFQFGGCTYWNNLKKCYDYDHNSIKDDDVGFSWTYQTCNEFGYFQSTSSDKHPFTKNIPIEFLVEDCTRIFGPEFNNTRIELGIDNVNKMYGGLKPNVTKVVFVNGELDPWSRLGILEDLSHEAPAIVIPRASHTRDLLISHESDEKELKEARKKIKNLIKKWIL